MQSHHHTRKTISKPCEYCSENFEAPLYEHRRGYAKYCSKPCLGRALSKKLAKKNPPNTTCSGCGSEFYRAPSKLKQAKHGYMFCSRRCKEAAQTIGSATAIAAIMPAHYGDASANYRAKALVHHGPKCKRCGYDNIVHILQVHHVDRDRRNNDVENLEVLCPNCHMEEHFLAGDGAWSSGKVMVEDKVIETLSLPCKGIALPLS